MENVYEQQIQTLNKEAMEDLRNEVFDSCFDKLTTAQNMLYRLAGSNAAKLQAMTYNNFGCYYKRINKPDQALNYLKRALGIERKEDFDVTNLAGTHLNISAIYSQLGSHGQALTHSVTALKLLKTVTLENPKNVTALIIALHNTGLEYESLGNIEKAVSSYKYGLELAQQFLGNKHHFTTALLRSFLKLTTTDKKFLFEKQRVSRSRPPKTITQDFFLPAMSKRNSQDSGSRKSRNFRISPALSDKYELPSIEKPKARKSRLGTREYVKSLEQKIEFLQSKMENFEKRHKVLEEITKKNGFSDRYSRVESNKRNRAAIIIQKNWRRFLARKLYNQKIEKKSKEKRKLIKKSPKGLAVFKLPSAMKSYTLHPIAESKFENKSLKAVLIQSNFRRFLKQKSFKEIKNATVKIQSLIRMFICRGLYKKIVQAVSLIQGKWRSHKSSRVQ